jgi:CxxC motif-containing protein
MMIKKLTCIECPKGCRLTVDIENSKVIKVNGNKCPKGEPYAAAEIENPVRILTSAVLCQGLSLRMLPVRTNKPMPKSGIFEAMSEIKKIRVTKPLKSGDIIVKDFLRLDVNLIAARKAGRDE